ncbi:hypothetical protein ABPG72_022413 [Tetrahymena utriculariae]
MITSSLFKLENINLCQLHGVNSREGTCCVFYFILDSNTQKYIRVISRDIYYQVKNSSNTTNQEINQTEMYWLQLLKLLFKEKDQLLGDYLKNNDISLLFCYIKLNEIRCFHLNNTLLREVEQQMNKNQQVVKGNIIKLFIYLLSNNSNDTIYTQTLKQFDKNGIFVRVFTQDKKNNLRKQAIDLQELIQIKDLGSTQQNQILKSNKSTNVEINDKNEQNIINQIKIQQSGFLLVIFIFNTFALALIINFCRVNRLLFFRVESEEEQLLEMQTAQDIRQENLLQYQFM